MPLSRENIYRRPRNAWKILYHGGQRLRGPTRRRHVAYAHLCACSMTLGMGKAFVMALKPHCCWTFTTGLFGPGKRILQDIEGAEQTHGTYRWYLLGRCHALDTGRTWHSRAVGVSQQTRQPCWKNPYVSDFCGDHARASFSLFRPSSLPREFRSRLTSASPDSNLRSIPGEVCGKDTCPFPKPYAEIGARLSQVLRVYVFNWAKKLGN